MQQREYLVCNGNGIVMGIYEFLTDLFSFRNVYTRVRVCVADVSVRQWEANSK